MAHAGGRPLKYTADRFSTKVDIYFKSSPNVVTFSGLLLYLDISRETWREYKERPQFVDTIKKAELRIEECWVLLLNKTTQVAGPIFYLKNAIRDQYRDSHDITSDGKSFPIYGGLSIPGHDGNKADISTSKED